MRLGWMGQVATDWMGDRGIAKSLEVRALLPNLFGDVLWCRGKVSNKRLSDSGEGLVDLELWAENQDHALSSRGTATVALPRRAST